METTVPHLKLIDFLVYLLEAQGQTLKRLAAFFGEEVLLQMLEIAGDMPDQDPSSFHLETSWFESSKNTPASSYQELEGTVHEMKLPAVFEFHLWAYPFYRLLIESSLDLSLNIRLDERRVGEILINEASLRARNWIKKLPIPPDLGVQAERIAAVPWVRFRAEVLRKMGKRPVFNISDR